MNRSEQHTDTTNNYLSAEVPLDKAVDIDDNIPRAGGCMQQS